MLGSRNDPLAALSADDRVAAAALAAREEIDALLWRRDVRGAAAEVASASIQRGARASAAMDGADLALVDDSPMGRVLDAALRLTAAVPTQVEVFSRAPLQALAHLHALTAHGFVTADDLGRPRSDDRVDDPLNLGAVVPAASAADRLALLAQTLTAETQAPAIVVSAIAHAELAVVRPFGWGSGLLARAATRLVLAGRGVDPSLFGIPEHGMLEQGRASYVRALRGYASGTREGVCEFIVWHATAVGVGARDVVVP